MKRKYALLTTIAFIFLISAVSCGSASQSDSAAQDSAGLMPAAVLVNPYDGNSLSLVNPQQETIGSIPVDNAGSLDASSVFPAGRLGAKDSTIPLLLTSYSPETAIHLLRDGQSSVLRTFDMLGSAAGSDGQGAAAFSEVVQDEYCLKSFLYVGTVDEVGFSTSVYEMDDYLDQWVIAPLTVEVVEGQPSGVWYTTSGWGVGGPGLFFPITEGLYYYDVASGNVTEVLDDGQSYQGFSPDRQMAGSVPSSSYQDHALTITNLATHWKLTYPLKSSSDQGAGYAVFAPDNQHVAWLEVGASPYDSYDFSSVVRIGNLSDGKVAYELEENALTQAAGFDEISGIQPAGWLDNDTLLIQVRGSDWTRDAAIVQMRLSDHSLSPFCQGAFLALIY